MSNECIRNHLLLFSNELTFNNSPKAIIIQGTDSTLSSGGTGTFSNGLVFQSYGVSGRAASDNYIIAGILTCSTNGATMNWYGPSMSGPTYNAQLQLNGSGHTYYYIGII